MSIATHVLSSLEIAELEGPRIVYSVVREEWDG